MRALPLTISRHSANRGNRESIELAKYFDERGRKVLEHEYPLRELGLIVGKARVGEWTPSAGSGGVFGLYDLQFRKTSEKFSEQLVEFMRDTLNFSPDDITRLQEQAVLVSES